MRKLLQYKPKDVATFVQKLVAYSATETHFSLLYSGGNTKNRIVENNHNWIAAIGCIAAITPKNNAFSTLKQFKNETNDWLFGYLSYDLKNETEKLTSKNNDGIKFPLMQFVQPEVVLKMNDNKIIDCFYFSDYDIEKKLEEIERSGVSTTVENESITFKAKITKEEYFQKVNQLLHHIRVGDIYEVNFCQEFFAETANFNPQTNFLDLLKQQSTPFSCFVKSNTHYILSFSPERFLKKKGNKLYSQPIKGTIKRGKTEEEDSQLAAQLLANEKERSENVMIVDLVRNDLAKIATECTVKVEELFGIYSFQTVHQMISTISAQLKQNCDAVDAIKACFPMGSMTGAPKMSAMQLIETHEKTKRGVYSGAVGYFDPQGDFDFNVIIRTLLYNTASNYLSLMAGSAITANSIPEKEYEECLLKAQAFFNLVGPLKISKNAK